MATRLKNREEQEPIREQETEKMQEQVKGQEAVDESETGKTQAAGRVRRRRPSAGSLVALALSLAAALAFLLLYPGFQERAEEEEPDILSGSEFLHEIYQANIVLYRQLQEAVTGKKVNAQDIYLAAVTNKAEGYQGVYYDFDGETPLSYAGERLDSLVDTWDTNMADGIGASIDYEILDNVSERE